MENDWTTRATLIIRSQDQDDEMAWEEFTNYYQGFILIVLKKMAIHPNVHDDVVQECLLKIWKGLPQFQLNQDRAKFRTWLHTVIRNTAFSYFTKNKKHHLDKVSIDHEETATVLQTDCEIGGMIEKEWEIYICERAMKNIQKLFSERALNVFKMFIEGVEVSEIAEKMDIKENSVYKLKNRVKAKYQQEIKDLCHHLEPGHELS